MYYEGKKITLYDGPKGSMFMAKGLKGCADIYNIESYETARDVVSAYADAGSEWIQTNTFNSNGLALVSRGYGDRQKDIIGNAIKAAREAADSVYAKTGKRPEVIFATGPTGKMIEPFGDVPEEEAYAAYKTQFETAASFGLYNVHVETFMDLNEMTIALRAASDLREELKKEGKDYKIYATMAFEAHGRTMFGNSPADCTEVFKEYGVDAFGANCACTAKEMLPVIKAFAEAAGPDAQIIAKPNAGKPITEGDKLMYAETPLMYAEACIELIKAGAVIVGGCCGTSPEHIRALGELLEE